MRSGGANSLRRRNFFAGVATLVAVEPTSLVVLTSAKTDDRSGAAWQAVLEPFTKLECVISDGAKGIAAGVQAVVGKRADAAKKSQSNALPLEHGLDVFHTNYEASRVLAGPWRRLESAWDEAEEADAKVAAEKRCGRDARGVASHARHAWERVEQLFTEYEEQNSAWQRARSALAVFRPDGSLNDRTWAESEIRVALTQLTDAKWKKVRNFLLDTRSLVFLDRLHRRLAEAEPDVSLRTACVERWRLRHHRASSSATSLVGSLLEAKIRDGVLSPEEQASYERVSKVLRTTVRASSAVEGMNSVLRMQQGRHRRMTQGLLDLKRLYWNSRRLQTGPRRGSSPYELLGAKLPSTDFWTLLQTVGIKPVAEPTESLSNQADAT